MEWSLPRNQFSIAPPFASSREQKTYQLLLVFQYLRRQTTFKSFHPSQIFKIRIKRNSDAERLPFTPPYQLSSTQPLQRQLQLFGLLNHFRPRVAGSIDPSHRSILRRRLST